MCNKKFCIKINIELPWDKVSLPTGPTQVAISSDLDFYSDHNGWYGLAIPVLGVDQTDDRQKAGGRGGHQGWGLQVFL